MSYDVDILSEIEESLEKILNEELLKIISMLNRKNQLEEFLELIAHQELIPGKNDLSISKSDFKDKLMDLLDTNIIEA